MSAPKRPVYDPWRDVDGTPIADGAVVEQVGIAKEHGALSARLHKQGVVIGRPRRGGNRLYVRFDGETAEVSIRPHLLRLVPPALAPRDVERIIEALEQLRDLAWPVVADSDDRSVFRRSLAISHLVKIDGEWREK
ncbi:MAG: hypothetical protein ACRDQU_12520 [Pseudonocardiaceae bacterium]